jgi:hypothetical protein
MALYDETLIRSFERACEKYSNHTALIYIGENIKYTIMKSSPASIAAIFCPK